MINHLIPIKYFQTGIIVSGQNSKLGQLGSNGSTILNRTISGVNKVTSFITGSNTKYFDYKRIGQYDDEPETNDKISNMMSFQMYTLKNCEIDPVSFEGYMPSTMNNSQFFKIGTGAIKINYDRCYKHTYNEWNKMMYGSDGFEVNQNISSKMVNIDYPFLEVYLKIITMGLLKSTNC